MSSCWTLERSSSSGMAQRATAESDSRYGSSQSRHLLSLRPTHGVCTLSVASSRHPSLLTPMRRQTPALEQIFFRDRPSAEVCDSPRGLKRQNNSCVWDPGHSPQKPASARGYLGGLSASLGFFDRLCFWQRISATGNEGAVLR